jgi:hypothetical protein
VCGCGGSQTTAPAGGSGFAFRTTGAPLLVGFEPEPQPLPGVTVTATRDTLPWWLWLLLALLVLRAVLKR